MTFRELCKGEEKAKKEKKIEKMGNAKTEREMWGYINEGRKRRRMEKTLWEYTKGQGRENYRQKRIIIMPRDDIEELKDIEIEEQIDKQKT